MCTLFRTIGTARLPPRPSDLWTPLQRHLVVATETIRVSNGRYASYWNTFLFFCALLFFITTGFFPGDTSGPMFLLGERDVGGRVSMGVGISGWGRGLWYLDVGYTPPCQEYRLLSRQYAPCSYFSSQMNLLPNL